MKFSDKENRLRYCLFSKQTKTTVTRYGIIIPPTFQFISIYLFLSNSVAVGDLELDPQEVKNGRGNSVKLKTKSRIGAFT